MVVRDVLRAGYRKVLLQNLPLPLRRRWLYRRNHGRWPNLRDPRLFSEKVNWRLIHDRREILSGTCDKQWMKSYAAGLGIDPPGTIWVGTDLAELQHVDLPKRWVLKPNHRSGLVHFGEGRPRLAELESVTADWMRPFQSVDLGEWAYTTAARLFIVEERIGGDEPPEDYKIFVFDGIPRIVQVDSQRFSGHRRRLYLPDWTPLDVQNRKPLGEVTPPPQSLDSMLRAAAALGAPFDFMRIDLYAIGSAVYFGETTPYPAGGLDWYSPRAFDAELGSWWNLPALKQ